MWKAIKCIVRLNVFVQLFKNILYSRRLVTLRIMTFSITTLGITLINITIKQTGHSAM